MTSCGKPWWNPCSGGPKDLCAEGPALSCKCCARLIEIIKSWTNPAGPCSQWRQTLCPITESDLYKRYSSCKVDEIVLAIGVVGAIVTGSSFLFRKPWWKETESCFGNESPLLWTILVMVLYGKSVLLNVIGFLTHVGLVYGVYSRVPDFVHLWLLWRAAAVAIGIAVLATLFCFNFLVRQDLKPIFTEELGYIALNIAMWIAVFAYFQQICECDQEEDGGGGAGGNKQADDAVLDMSQAEDEFYGRETTSVQEGSASVSARTHLLSTE